MGEAIRCILCACCVGACPISNENEKYLGPGPLVQAFRRIFDSRDEGVTDRLKQLDYPDGVWACVNHFECTSLPQRNPGHQGNQYDKERDKEARLNVVREGIRRALS